MLFAGAISFLYLYYQVKIPLQTALYEALLNTSIYIGVTFALPYSAAYIEFRVVRISRFIGIHLLAASIINLTITILHLGITSFVSSASEFHLTTLSSFLWRWLIWYFLYLVVQSINYALIYYNSTIEGEIQETKMHAMLKEAELRNLRYQINPHFLFNSLNSIVSLININAVAAQTMLIKLSEFFRFSLKHDFNSIIPLKDEIDAVEHYLSIEKLRFMDKLQLHIQCDEETLPLPVPALILQPLIENAIKHGVYQAVSTVELCISSTIADGFLKISIENELEGGNKADKKDNTGIGLKNTRNRLQIMYNMDNLLSIEATEYLFKVHVFIPLKEK